MSSEQCNGASMSRSSDCADTNLTFNYQADTAQEVREMYQTITERILSTKFFITFDEEGNPQVTEGSIEDGTGVELPFPQGFVCQDHAFTVPIRNSFIGEGSMRYSNFEFTYCPLTP